MVVAPQGNGPVVVQPMRGSTKDRVDAGHSTMPTTDPSGSNQFGWRLSALTPAPATTTTAAAAVAPLSASAATLL